MADKKAEPKILTDTVMRVTKPEPGKDQWFTRAFPRGGGIFAGRITPAGERLFYFRYTDSKSLRPYLPIGPYKAKGAAGGLTLEQACDRASELSALYRSGVKDLPAERRLQNRAKDSTALVLAGGRWTAHDLRRTAATLMARIGISTDVIEECLNHKLKSKVARVYIKDRRLGEQARAFDALGVLLQAIVELRNGHT